MITDTDTFPAEPASDFICPQCQAKVNACEVVCPECGVDLAWAAALAERQVLAAMPAAAGATNKGDVLLPRFGEYLLRRGYITDPQLQAALTRQREAALLGSPQTIGQALFEMGAVSREQLDLASIEQVKQLQEALQASNRHLERRVNERTLALQQALQQLAALSELKANLVGNLSHNLRSPVVPIQGYGTLLAYERLGPLTEAQREAVDIILRSVTHLESVINEMGQLSSNLRGQVQVQAATFALPSLVERLKTFFAPKAASAGIQLLFDVVPDLPFASGDIEKIWWVLFQLFDSALKPMSDGGELALTAEATASRIKVTVRDTGPSIPPTQLDEILHLPLEFISRLADSRGWALAQIKRIVEAHGTRFSVEARPEQGTTVAFELPVAD